MPEIDERDVHSLLNAFHDGACCLSARGELLCFNEAARQHWKLPQKHVAGLLHLSPVARALSGETVHYALVHRGEAHDLLISTVPLRGGDGGITAVMIVSQDVSQHVAQQRQAEMSLDVLVEAVLATQDVDDIDEALRRVATLIPRLESVDNSIAFRVDERTNSLSPVALYGSSQQSYAEWSAELSAIELSTEHALQSSPAYLQALHLKTPITVDFASHAVGGRSRNLRAAIYAPILLDGQVLGLLGAERHRPLGEADTYFPQWGVDLLKALARLVSMSMEKISLLDVSARQQEEIEVMRRLLSQKDDFLSLTAHELKNPLTAIRGQAQIMQRRIKRSLHPDADDDHELLLGLKSIEHQTKKIVHMMDALLDVSRLDLDRLELELHEIDVIQLARRTLEEYLPMAQDHELRLLVDGHPFPLLTGEADTLPRASMKIVADEERLEQVLINLISNAVKYSPQGGPVTLSLRNTADGALAIAIEDQGIGIPPAEQERLTERFFRARNAQDVDAKGLGLGLYLVDALIAKHGGTLTIQSEGVPGKGSSFTITLPLRVYARRGLSYPLPE
jgi:signal transduction histidine kinase